MITEKLVEVHACIKFKPYLGELKFLNSKQMTVQVKNINKICMNYICQINVKLLYLGFIGTVKNLL